jgi:DNA-binding NtrC family response regulator
MIEAESFREDLFFRMNTFEIHLPSLRERKSDVAPLAQHMLARYASRHGRHAPTLTAEALDLLSSQDWPGNIRELANAIERAMILSGGGPIGPEHLPTQIPIRRPSGPSSGMPSGVPGPHFQIPDGSPTLRDIEMKYIQVILEKHSGNKPAASKELGISLKTLYNKINQLQQG